MKHFRCLLIFSVLALAIGLPKVNAAFQYDFIFSQASYSGVVGGPNVSVLLSLRETTTAGETPRFDVGGLGGLYAAGMRLNYTGSAASVTGIGSISIDSAFNDTASNVRTVGAGFARAQGFSSDVIQGIESGTGPANVRIIPFATFAFTPSSEGTVNLSLADFHGVTTDSIFAGTLNGFDNLINFSATSAITISAVPEPTSMTLLGCVAVGGLAYKRWRRKK